MRPKIEENIGDERRAKRANDGSIIMNKDTLESVFSA
jgi:hypothetical protein